MSIIDHSGNYDLKLDFLPDDFSGKFFWFSGINHNLSNQKENIYQEPSPVTPSDEKANTFFNEEPHYASPTEIFFPSPDSPYEVPPNHNHDKQKQVLHMYDVPDVRKSDDHSNNHDYELPKTPQYENSDVFYPKISPIEDLENEYAIPDCNLNSPSPRGFSGSKEYFNEKKGNSESNDDAQDRYKTDSVEDEYLVPVDVNFTESVPNMENELMPCDENDPQQDNNISPEDEEYYKFLNDNDYGSGVWFGFSGQQFNTHEKAMDHTEERAIPASDKLIEDEPPPIPLFISNTESLPEPENEIPTEIIEDMPPMIEDYVNEVEKAPVLQNEISMDLDPPLIPEDNNEDAEKEQNYFEAGLKDVEESPPLHAIPSDTNLNEFEYTLDDFTDHLEHLEEIEKLVMAFDNLSNDIEDQQGSPIVEKERSPSPESPPARPPPPRNIPSTSLNRRSAKKSNNQSNLPVNNPVILDQNKTYAIEITPQPNKELEIENESSYHITFIEKDKKYINDQPLTSTINEMPRKQTDDNSKNKSLSKPQPSVENSLQKSYSLERDNKKNPGVSIPSKSITSEQKNISDTNEKPKKNEFKSKDAPQKTLAKSQSFDTGLSKGSPTLHRNTGRRKSSRFIEEQPKFSSLKNFFEDPSSPIEVEDNEPVRNDISSKKDRKSKLEKTKNLEIEEPITVKNIKNQFEIPTNTILGDSKPKDNSKTLDKTIDTKENDVKGKISKEKSNDKKTSLQSSVLPRRMSLKSEKRPSIQALKGAPSPVSSSASKGTPRNLRRSKDDSDKPRISIRSQQSPKMYTLTRSRSFGAIPIKRKVVEDVLVQNSKEMKVFYQFQDQDVIDSNKDNTDRIDNRRFSSSSHENEFGEIFHSKKIHHVRTPSSVSLNSLISSDEDASNLSLSRGTSFRRSIVIDDEVEDNRKKSKGEVCISVFYQHMNGDNDPNLSVSCQKYKNILDYIDNLVMEEENFGVHFDAVRQLHQIFWDLKDNEHKSNHDEKENLTSVLNYLVSQEWPKIILGCLKKFEKAYRRVFLESRNPENIIYYSGHLPSGLRMNRCSEEYAMSAIFDGLLKAAINFTDVHTASRIACCEENLIEYLVKDIVPLLSNIRWGKSTARQSFLKSICDLIYNCAQSTANVSPLIKYGTVNILSKVADESYDEPGARKVVMTILLALTFLMDNSNYEQIVPFEGTVIRLLQFLDKSLEHSEHTYLDFYAAELTECISRLCSHDTIREYVTRNSGQEILHKLLKHSYDDEERIAACNALWNLSFNHEAKNTLRGMGKLLIKLRDLKRSSNPSLSCAASGILWECEEKYDIKGTRESYHTIPNQIMISYEGESRSVVLSIQHELKMKGFQVIMNYDNDETELQEKMTRGVERASIVIAALTRKYKQTPRTFAEIDYAHKLRKCIIPLVLEKDFSVDGWLSQYLQSSQKFDFSKRSMISGSLDALLEYILTLTTQNKTRILDEMSRKNTSINRDKDVLSWSNDDVISWLKENKLIRALNQTSRLQKITGLHLLMFYDLKKESPDYYYTVLNSHLGFKDVLDTLEFTYALDRLLGSERLI